MVLAALLIAFVIFSLVYQNKSYSKSDERLKQIDKKRLDARANREKRFIDAALTLKFLPLSEPVFHLPVYDSKEDEFIAPCQFSSFDSKYEQIDGIGWVDRPRINELMEYFAFNDEQSVFFLDNYDHLIIIKTESLYSPGGKVYQITRTDVNSWHVFGWYSGIASGNKNLDPVFTISAIASNPTLWQARQNRLRKIWEKNRNYQEVKQACTHRNIRTVY